MIRSAGLNKSWLDYLFDFLAGLMTKQSLVRAGAGSEAIGGAVTASLALPTFHTEPAPPPGILESRDLKLCHPELQRRYALVKAAARARYGTEFFETRTWSSAAAQFEHFKKGRHQEGSEWVLNSPDRAGVVTNLDGYKKRSRHNVFPAEAVDVCRDSDPGPGKVADWNPAAYAILGPLADEFGLVWGGRFRGFGPHGDYPHLELPAGAA